MSWCCKPVEGVPLLLPRYGELESWGLADAAWRKWMVELLEVGEPDCEASVSTWSMVWDCHPLLTLTMAYDSRVFNSADSWRDEVVGQHVVT